MAQGNKKAKAKPYQKSKPKGKAFTRKASKNDIAFHRVAKNNKQ